MKYLDTEQPWYVIALLAILYVALGVSRRDVDKQCRRFLCERGCGGRLRCPLDYLAGVMMEYRKVSIGFDSRGWHLLYCG